MTRPANDNYLAADAASLGTHLSAVLAEFPELAEDEDLRADTLEGLGLNDLLARLLGNAQDAKHMAGAVADRIGELQARKARFERRNEAMRGLIFRLMQAAGGGRVVLPESTLSIVKGRDRVEITDEARLPRWALRVVKSPDKAAIGERLKAGRRVPGAVISAGDPTLSVRVV